MNTLPDFDTMMNMSIEDLEDLRRNEETKLIAEAPNSQFKKLSGLQWKLGVIRDTAANPMDSCIKISALMHEEVHKLNDYLNGILEK